MFDTKTAQLCNAHPDPNKANSFNMSADIGKNAQAVSPPLWRVFGSTAEESIKSALLYGPEVISS
jgi:hypothetical protein